MVGNTGTMSLSVVRSKLGEHDESSAALASVAKIEIHQENITFSRNNSTNTYQNEARQQLTSYSKSDIIKSANNLFDLESIKYTRTSGGTAKDWVFPPKAPSPKIYNSNNHDAMAAGERNGLKDFKKQFSGRFKRLVSPKKVVTGPIPPELRPQLKMIYVY